MSEQWTPARLGEALWEKYTLDPVTRCRECEMDAVCQSGKACSEFGDLFFDLREQAKAEREKE